MTVLSDRAGCRSAFVAAGQGRCSHVAACLVELHSLVAPPPGSLACGSRIFLRQVQ